MDPEFDWRDHVAVRGDDAFACKVERCLDMMSQTPEGQDLIVNAAFLAQNQGYPYIAIRAHEECGQYGLKDDGPAGAGASPFTGELILIRDDLKEMEYLDRDGASHDMSLARVLVHEFFHLGDEQLSFYINSDEELQLHDHAEIISAAEMLSGSKLRNTAPEGEGDNRYEQAKDIFSSGEYDDRDADIAIVNANSDEIRAINFTNEYMKKYFDEPERAESFIPKPSGEQTPELDVYQASDMVIKPEF